MKTITMLEFRQNIPAIMRGLPQSGEILITHRGRPTARLSPPKRKKSEKKIDWENDPLFQMLDIAAALADPNEPMHEPLTNEMIDQILYGYGRACDP